MAALVLFLAGVIAMLPGGFQSFLARIRSTPLEKRDAVVRTYLGKKRLPLIEADTLVHFVWYGKADSLLLNGSLQDGWRNPASMEREPCSADPHGTAFFHRTYNVPQDALLEYQFLLNGQSMLDPGNVRTTPNGDFSNSQVAMPAFKPSPWTRRSKTIPAGTLDTIRFEPKDHAISPRTVLVYRPHGVKPGSSLPSIYIHDGASAILFMPYCVILDNLIAARALPPMIALFVPPVDRVSEYRGEQLDGYVNALADELVPLIDARYGTSRDHALRAIGGISDGGHCAVYAGLFRPDVFGLFVGQSTTILPGLSQLLDRRLREGTSWQGVAAYLHCGTYDIVNRDFNFPVQNREFGGRLRQLGPRYLFKETSDGHDWPSWRERLPEILRFLFKPN
jgi:enterochelin esterase family protein